MLYYYGEYSGNWANGDTITYPYVRKLVRYTFGLPKLPFSYELNLDQKPSNVKYVVVNAIKLALQKGTLVYDSELAMWWVVDTDTSVYVTNNIGTYEYEHTLECKDAFEFLNGIDLPNCSFKADRYTFTQFMSRLFNISKFVSKTSITYSGFTGLTATTKNEFIAYDGYTLSNAIKEFGRANQVVPTLSITTAVYSSTGHPLNGMTYISSMSIVFVKQTGLGNTPTDISATNDDYEQSKCGGESFATTVVSNLKNAQSSLVNVYPNFGGSFLFSPNVAEVALETAQVNLPSNIQQVNKIRVYQRLVRIEYDVMGSYGHDFEISQYFFNKTQIFDYLISALSGVSVTLTSTEQARLLTALTDPFVDIENEDGADNRTKYGIVQNDYRGMSHNVGGLESGDNDDYIYLKQKAYRDTINYAHRQNRTMYWEQGKNTIQGFKWCSMIGTDTYYSITFALDDDYPVRIDFYYEKSAIGKKIANHLFQVFYYPQCDIKIAYENDKLGNYAKYYNQTGKIIDSFNASKLLTAYVDESSALTRIKKAKYYSYASILPIGSNVLVDGESMIIGSMSVVVEATDLYSVTYSLSTDRIGRSEDVTADSSIKDTDIPQKNNIVRDQLYRDYIEVGYTKDYTCDTSLFMGSPSTQLASLLVFNDDGCGFNLNCVAYIKGVDSASTVYYRAIDAIEYDLCKAKLLVADFQDNNHLGYYRERKIV